MLGMQLLQQLAALLGYVYSLAIAQPLFVFHLFTGLTGLFD